MRVFDVTCIIYQAIPLLMRLADRRSRKWSVAPSRPLCRSRELSSPPTPYAGSMRSDRASRAAGPLVQGR